MAKYCGAACRLCRREGEKLFLKGERCYTSKCAIERRPSAPGQHGARRGSFSDFKMQLREKQKVKRIFNMLEKQFRKVAHKALHSKGVSGTELLQSLERRLDNMVYRMGFASSRRQARQLVGHGLITVNGKPVNIPSYQVDVGDTVEVREKSKKNVTVQSSIQNALGRFIPEWVTLDKDGVKGELKALPVREQMAQSIKENLIVELYSR